MIRIVIVIVLLAAAFVWQNLADRSWQTLGSNLFVALLQLAVGLAITEVLIQRHRRKRLNDIAGIEIGVKLRAIERLLCKYADEQLRSGPLTGRWEFKSALLHDLAKRARKIQWHSDDIAQAIDKYRDFLTIDEAAPLLKIRENLNALVWLSSQICLSDKCDSTSLCRSLQHILENLRLASGIYAYKCDKTKFKRVEQLMVKHHHWYFPVAGKISSVWWKPRHAIGI